MRTAHCLASLALSIGAFTALAPRLVAHPDGSTSESEACCAAPVCCASEGGNSKKTSAEASVGDPLRGVILEVVPQQSALLVKHEEIPGVMRAMTMLLKVNEPTLAVAKKGQAITARLVRKGDEWWLFEVTPIVAPPASPTAAAPAAS